MCRAPRPVDRTSMNEWFCYKNERSYFEAGRSYLEAELTTALSDPFYARTRWWMIARLQKWLPDVKNEPLPDVLRRPMH